MTSVGFIGLGTMGGPMARNVLKGGHDLVVLDINQAAVEKLTGEGAKAATSPKEVAQASDVVITMLPDAPDVERAVLGPDGILAGLRPGSTVPSARRPSTRSRGRLPS
jgi:3-hydroxyisobutyrate dehydrogenase-like beta-hydroxyacid dehydrogenase